MAAESSLALYVPVWARSSQRKEEHMEILVIVCHERAVIGCLRIIRGDADLMALMLQVYVENSCHKSMAIEEPPEMVSSSQLLL
jgi:N-acetylglutamate synthase-like GNAT family acetyltransferase